MAIALLENLTDAPAALDSACEALAYCGQRLSGHHRLLSGSEALQVILDVERASRLVDHLKIVAARLADEYHFASPDGCGDRPSPGAPACSPGGDGIVDAEPADAVAATAAASAAAVGLSASSTSPGLSASVASLSASTAVSSPSTGAGYRDCADFLRATLGIGRAEAKRRLKLAGAVLPTISPTGAAVPPRFDILSRAVGSGAISGRAATVVVQSLERVSSFATPGQLEGMERHLTEHAVESDEDILWALARRWEGVLDQDGQEPTEKVLRARQGVFLKGRRNGLHLLEIGATDDQFEHLVTVMNSTANPRLRNGGTEVPTGDELRGSAAGIDTSAPDADEPTDPSEPTRPQRLLDGLVSACRIALATGALPATGGHRPQVMVTIDYKDLIGETQRAGHAVFGQQVSARTIRTMACDADIIPLVLGGQGQILDVGRAQRLFPPHLRRALVARDKGCAFPDCSIPASWCEAHHIRPWARGGPTSIDNGVLLCSRHHHVIHQGTWVVEARSGIPWFTMPGRPGRAGALRRNTYWQAGLAVEQELVRHGVEASASRRSWSTG